MKNKWISYISGASIIIVFAIAGFITYKLAGKPFTFDPQITENRTIALSTNIVINKKLSLTVTQSDTPTLRLTGKKSNLGKIKIIQQEDFLTIEGLDEVKEEDGVDGVLGLPSIQTISVQDANVSLKKFTLQDVLMIKGSGTSKIYTEPLEVNALTVVLNNESNLELKGGGNSCNYSTLDTTSIYAKFYTCSSANVSAAGVSIMDITPVAKLDAISSDNGVVRYYGNSANVTKKILGKGSVINVKE